MRTFTETERFYFHKLENYDTVNKEIVHGINVLTRPLILLVK